jgi:Rad3-related DNA helicase
VDDTADVLGRLARLLGGRTLALFTSLRRMRDVRERLADQLRGEGFDLLMPRRATDDPGALVERFARAGGGALLLGSRTFWQGLDIVGPALSAVVIEKLPFQVPSGCGAVARRDFGAERDAERHSWRDALNLKDVEPDPARTTAAWW